MICGLAESEFQKAGKSFERHVDIEHCCWDYVNLYIYLKEWKKKDFTGTEIMMWNAIQKRDFSFIPNEESLSLAHEKEISIETQIATLESAMIKKIDDVKTHVVEAIAEVHSLVLSLKSKEKNDGLDEIDIAD